MLVVNTTSPATSPSPAKVHPSKAAPSSSTSVARLRPWLRPLSSMCSKPRSCPVVYWLSANYSNHDPALQRPPEIGGVGGAADERAPPYRPLLREVDEREISRRADGQTSGSTYPPARGAAHRLDEPSQRKPATKDQVSIEDGESRLVAEEPWRGL